MRVRFYRPRSISKLNAVKRLLRSLLPSRRSPEPPQTALHFVVAVPARLLVSISPESAARSGGPSQTLIGATQNISESVLAVLASSVELGNGPISEGDELFVTLELHPLGIVEMSCLVAGIEKVTKGEEESYLLGLKITRMSADGHALYLEYIGTPGWAKVLDGNGSSSASN